jgi:acetyl esterase/lipase
MISSLLLNACASVTREYAYHIEKDKIFKTVDGVDLKGDFYIPERAGIKPVVIVVHGGGWTSRSGEMRQVCADLAATGFVTFNITYRLAPSGLYPKAVDDVRDAVRYVRDHAKELEINPDQISGWGYSAGANLIFLVGLDPANHMKALVGGGTPANLTLWPHSPIVPKFIGYTFQERPDLWRDASPAYQVKSNSPPIFMYHGKWDHLVQIEQKIEQMHVMEAVLKEKGVPVETHEVSYMGHIATYLFSNESVQLGIDFLKKHQ